MFKVAVKKIQVNFEQYQFLNQKLFPPAEKYISKLNFQQLLFSYISFFSLLVNIEKTLVNFKQELFLYQHVYFCFFVLEIGYM